MYQNQRSSLSYHCTISKNNVFMNFFSCSIVPIWDALPNPIVLQSLLLLYLHIKVCYLKLI